MTYSVTVVREPDALIEVLPEWRDFIASKPHGCSVFNDPDVVEFAVSQNGPLPYIVMVRRAGHLTCIAPFGIHSTHFGLRLSVFKLASFSVRLLKLFGDDVVYSADADMAECCSLIFKSMGFQSFDLVYFEALDMQSRLWQYCASANGKPSGMSFARPASAREKSFQIELPPTFAEYLATLGSDTRRTIKRRTKKLLAEHGATLVKVTTADQVPSFLNDVDAIYRDSWQAKTYGHWKRNGDEEIARFEHIARQGWLHCYLLTSDVGPLAFQIGYLYGDMFYAFGCAFSQQWCSFGPGVVLMYMTLEDLFQSCRPRVIDLGYGDGALKRTFRGLSRDVGDYYVTPVNRWRHLVAAQRGLSEIETIARNALVRTGLDNVVRRALKHKLESDVTAKYEVTVIRELDDFQAVLPEWRNFSALSPPGSSFDNDPEIVASALSHKGSIPYIIMVRRGSLTMRRSLLHSRFTIWIAIERVSVGFASSAIAQAVWRRLSLCGRRRRGEVLFAGLRSD